MPDEAREESSTVESVKAPFPELVPMFPRCSACAGDGQVCSVCFKPGAICECHESNMPTAITCEVCRGTGRDEWRKDSLATERPEVKRVCAECGGSPFHAMACKFHVHGTYGTVVTAGQAKPVESLVPNASTIASAIEDWLDANKGLALYVGNASGDFDLINIDGQFRISELAAAVYERLVGEGVRFGEDR